jgi:hypothetical protein
MDYGHEWVRKGATLSDKTAREEFGLTQEEIIAAINAGKLQYRPAATHGNPWPRLLRREVEDLVRTRHGERYLREQQAQTELKRVQRELRQLRTGSRSLRKDGQSSFPNSPSKADDLASWMPDRHQGHAEPSGSATIRRNATGSVMCRA